MILYLFLWFFYSIDPKFPLLLFWTFITLQEEHSFLTGTSRFLMVIYNILWSYCGQKILTELQKFSQTTIVKVFTNQKWVLFLQGGCECILCHHPSSVQLMRFGSKIRSATPTTLILFRFSREKTITILNLPMSSVHNDGWRNHIMSVTNIYVLWSCVMLTGTNGKPNWWL